MHAFHTKRPPRREPRGSESLMNWSEKKEPLRGRRRPALPRADPAVPSALGGLTSGFGMGPGVPPPPWPPATKGLSRRSFLAVPSGPHSARAIRTNPRGGTAKPALHCLLKERGGRARTISGARLCPSRGLHLRPIEQVVYLCPYRKGRLISGRASRLDAFSGYPDRTQLPGDALGEQPVHRRSVHPGPLVLGAASISSPAPTEDRDRTVSRRSEPSSRTALNGEQPYPWDLLQPQDAMSRHRGAKPSRRCGLLGKISLLSPEYLLSVERRPYHSAPPDH